MLSSDLSWWDPYSDQPYKLPDSERPGDGAGIGRERAAVAATVAAKLPTFLWRAARLRPVAQRPAPQEFIGLSISPDARYDTAVRDMVQELGAQLLLLRVPTWERERLETYRALLDRYPAHDFLINVLQSRDSVQRPELWRQDLANIFRLFGDRVDYFQIGNAINRSKWGCAHSGDYLRLLEIAEEVRGDAASNIRLVGSSVIDFEPLVTLRTLHNRCRYHLDVVSALLYVNRRGSPWGRQYGIFDLHTKLRVLCTLVLMGNRNARRLWVTEFNWPLLNTKPYTPNSGHPRSTVDEPTQARYLRQYYRIAYQTGWVERVYWWQLINPGYGLVDHRGGTLRRHPSYFALQELLRDREALAAQPERA